MAKSSAVTIGTTPTLLNVAEDLDRGEQRLELFVPSLATVFVGGMDVTTNNGLTLIGPTVRAFVLSQAESLYAISSTAGVGARVLQTGIGAGMAP